jgi:hypothetical protein
MLAHRQPKTQALCRITALMMADDRPPTAAWRRIPPKVMSKVKMELGQIKMELGQIGQLATGGLAWY